MTTSIEGENYRRGIKVIFLFFYFFFNFLYLKRQSSDFLVIILPPFKYLSSSTPLGLSAFWKSERSTETLKPAFRSSSHLHHRVWNRLHPLHLSEICLFLFFSLCSIDLTESLPLSSFQFASASPFLQMGTFFVLIFTSLCNFRGDVPSLFRSA